jgi:hypothetical protein
MAYDANLYITGTASNPEVSFATNSAAGAAGVTNLRTNAVYHADLRIVGTIDGTTGTVSVSIQESTSATTGYNTVAAFPPQTSVMTNANGFGSGPVSVTFRVTKPFTRVGVTLSSTAAVTGLSVRVRPTGEPALP